MKKVKITDIKSNILEYTKTKKIRAVEFIFTIEQKEFKKVAFLLDTKVFSVRFPFSLFIIRLRNFKKYSIEKQIETIERICIDYVNDEIEIGTYDDNYIDLKIEKALRENIFSENNTNILPCFFYISDGPILSYNELDEFSDFVKKLINIMN